MRMRGLTRYEYLDQIEGLMDQALNELSPNDFEKFKDDVKALIDRYTA